MKNISDISVNNISLDGSRASANWSGPDARFHVWFDTKTKSIEPYTGTGGTPTVFKNPPLSVNRGEPGHFETRRLDARVAKHTAVIAYVFSVVERDGLMAKAIARKNAEENAREAKQAAYAWEHRVKEAGPRLLARLKDLCEGSRDWAAARALIAELEPKS